MELFREAKEQLDGELSEEPEVTESAESTADDSAKKSDREDLKQKQTQFNEIHARLEAFEEKITKLTSEFSKHEGQHLVVVIIVCF